jgi:hypothetical protein
MRRGLWGDHARSATAWPAHRPAPSCLRLRELRQPTRITGSSVCGSPAAAARAASSCSLGLLVPLRDLAEQSCLFALVRLHLQSLRLPSSLLDLWLTTLLGGWSAQTTFCFLAGFDHKHIVPMLPCLDIMRRSCVHQGKHLMITPQKYCDS